MFFSIELRLKLFSVQCFLQEKETWKEKRINPDHDITIVHRQIGLPVDHLDTIIFTRHFQNGIGSS
jgi:hypothetical protein